MIRHRPAASRGRSHTDWLDSAHSFSFADYQDPEAMGFGSLRVINDDIVGPEAGFPMHPHRDMEIITYVLGGRLEHRDSMGNGSIIGTGDVQVMCAGTGVRHSEWNPSATESVHLLQIWVLPPRRDLPPSYGQRHFPAAAKQGRWCAIAGGTAGDALPLHQDLRLLAALLDGADTLDYSSAPDRQLYLQVARGHLELNEQILQAGDGVAITGAASLRLHAAVAAEVLLFDMAAPTPG